MLGQRRVFAAVVFVFVAKGEAELPPDESASRERAF
jgi:hypothetical protein